MKKYEERIVEEICIKYCKTKKFIILLMKICKDNNIKNAKKYIEDYFSVSKSVSKRNNKS